jgi:glycosyltransferase involved in cell wall biosynthesis
MSEKTAASESPSAPAAGRAPHVTVGIPCYNCANRIGRTVEALLADDCQDFELLLAEGGSTDNSLEVLKGLARRDPRIRVIKDVPNNAGSKRNAVMNGARGRLMVCCDDDFVPAPGWIRAYVEASKSWDMLMTGTTLPGGPGPRVAVVARTRRIEMRPTFLAKIAANRVGTAVQFGCPVEFAKALGGWDARYKTAQDWDFNLRVLLSGHSVLALPEALGYHDPLPDWPAYVRKRYKYARALTFLMRSKYSKTLVGWATVAASFVIWFGVLGKAALTLNPRMVRAGFACLRGGVRGLFDPKPKIDPNVSPIAQGLVPPRRRVGSAVEAER